MQLVVQVRDLHLQRLIILQHALHQADERRDEGHDSLESAPIGRRDVLPVKVGEIYVKPFEYRWGSGVPTRRPPFPIPSVFRLIRRYTTQLVQGPERNERLTTYFGLFLGRGVYLNSYQ